MLRSKVLVSVRQNEEMVFICPGQMMQTWEEINRTGLYLYSISNMAIILLFVLVVLGIGGSHES
jgi:hypothetical protein